MGESSTVAIYKKAEQAALFHGYRPLAVLEDFKNAFNDYACDIADAISATLNQNPSLAENHREIEQGLDRWLLKLQRAGDASFDCFERQALRQVFNIPDDLQDTFDESLSDDCSKDDEDIAQLTAKLHHAVAVSREMQRRLAALQHEQRVWEVQQSRVQQLVSAHQPEAVEQMLRKSQQLGDHSKQVIWNSVGTDKQEFVVPRRLLRHRENTNTVSMMDLKQLSALLCA
mmetsp:Transcript_63161/g.105047  ORF Transcript_63161/g.105047 Transcript_63161/m.105047 type:complete len:229 (-) Transcript_63161:328-1014(-)|eukprot:CAMPEP_0119312018 /NCGR_PEP_ID=MMETSP1333-20130426/24751_1 /TAXON_ID=418940 /ORGANISM="Scyphosphaera apsteinii, Strain RCC1455" /LENGTH=228 /DNA_ID=CAMNT_0007316553 /DNA_START=31 /DNA_END=717 /DNA_ORIENTATION=+